MSDGQKTIKPNPETKARLDELKRDGETWDGFLNRAADAVEATREKDGHVPVCTGCANRATEWTVEDGNLVCTLCAKGDLR